MSDEAEDPGCSMAGRACREAGGYGREGYCEVRRDFCPKACLKRSLAMSLRLSEQRSAKLAKLDQRLYAAIAECDTMLKEAERQNPAFAEGKRSSVGRIKRILKGDR